jgi:hypothetical protein
MHEGAAHAGIGAMAESEHVQQAAMYDVMSGGAHGCASIGVPHGPATFQVPKTKSMKMPW